MHEVLEEEATSKEPIPGTVNPIHFFILYHLQYKLMKSGVLVIFGDFANFHTLPEAGKKGCFEQIMLYTMI